MSGDYDIIMNLDETLELDTIVKKSSIAKKPISSVNYLDGGSYDKGNLDSIQTNTVIFDPPDSGEYEFYINGQLLSINVKDETKVSDTVEYAYLGSNKSDLAVYEDTSGNGDFTFSNTPDNFASGLPKDDANSVFILPNEKRGFVHNAFDKDGSPSNTITEFTFSDYLLNTVSIENTYSFINGNFGGIGSSIQFSKDGKKMYASLDRYSNGDEVEVWSLSNSFDISSSSRISVKTVSGFNVGSGHLGNIIFNSDGSRVYHGTRGGNQLINQYDLNIPFDLTSKSSPDTFDPPSGDPLMISWNKDGSAIYVFHHSPNNIDKHELSTPYDITSVNNSITLQSDGTGLNNSDGFSTWVQNHFR